MPFIIITKKKYKLKWKHFGFKKIGILRTIGLVLSSYLLYIGISILIAVFILYTNIRIPGYQVQEEILPIFGNGIPNLIIVGVMVVGIAPIVEELIFRGFFLRTLSNKIGVFWGSILTATIFAVLHVPWQSFIPIFILGLIINRMVIHSKSLWPAIVFHMLNNSIVFAVAIAIENDLINLEELVILIS